MRQEVKKQVKRRGIGRAIKKTEEGEGRGGRGRERGRDGRDGREGRGKD